MHTPSPPLPPRARVYFEWSLYMLALLVILLTFADRHGFWPTLALQFSAMLAIVALTRGLPYLLTRRKQR